MSKTPLPEDIAAAVKRETAGELIRWTGQPDAARAARWSLLIWLFALPWTGFTLFLASTTVRIPKLGTGMPDIWRLAFELFGILFMLPFLLVGLAMIAAPLWVWRKSRATAWVVTDKRLLVVEVYRKTSKVKTIWPERIVSIERTERADGSGSLKLLLGRRTDSDGDTVSETEMIYAADQVRKLEQLLAAFRPQPTVAAQARSA